MDNNFKNTFDYKVIYVFTINDENHKNLVKIGDTTIKTETTIDMLSPNCKELNQAALARIKSYTNTAGLTPKLLHTELALRNIKKSNGTVSVKAFRDHDVHEILKNSGFNNITLGNTTGKEWFQIDVDIAKKAIDAVKHNYSNLSNTDVVKHAPIIFRPEQTECISKVVKHFKKADKFLINAKMRYGKTFVSLEIIKQCNFKKTIIITHRPVVDSGWYDDFTKIFYKNNAYIYGSKSTGYTVDKLLKTKKNIIYFASVQDLRDSSHVGGKYDKNALVFTTHWDCVIVDEAHEGTTTELGRDTLSAIVKEGSGTKYLSLSGTPFNILTEYDENSIYTWDYIMEQESKSEWDKLNFGDSNPYEELPELRIYTYDLGDILANNNYISFEDKAFNFHEFFRTWTGDYNKDYANMPPKAIIGDFVHEDDVTSFLNLLTKEDPSSGYPFSNEKYRNLFKHSLWIVPGVKEAKAFKKLMLKHPIFGNGMFDIVNVAGIGDEEEKSKEALTKVRKAIKEAGTENYTITLSCGRLTTGVTVKEWTAVFMLSGSYSTSAANYLQTIFRVQSPCNKNGKFKETSYVFDFAPDRTLRMVSNAVSISTKAGKTKIGDAAIIGKFLNYCPVISVSGSEMKEYSAKKLLQQLKKAYADKVVRNGFDDSNLYNDELFKLQAIDIKKFDELKGIIGKSNAAQKQNNITVNDQGLTDEEYEESENLKKKPKKDLSPEEKARLEELKKMKKLRNDAISILRGISIRMPLLIYGADIPYNEEIDLDKFIKVIDDSSWSEFMPSGVTKEKFKEFKKYYDEEVFISAGRKIRNIAREADTLEPTERVKKIASLFSYFKNPDKETVLTPWRVVNMHMSACLGGWDFFDENHEEILDTPRFVNHGQVTSDVFDKEDTQILEINSKTGLYPLYMAYSVFKEKCNHQTENLNENLLNKLWFSVIENNIFVICKTPMAKAITKRTLIGYTNNKINAHYFNDLINIIQNKSKLFSDKITSTNYWKRGGKFMKFDAIVGNPPYQQETGGAGRQAKPVYNLFVEQAKNLNPNYLSMITPSRWFSGGMGLNDFRDNMISDHKLIKLVDFTNAKDCFPQISISGGVCYFLWNNNWDGDCEVTNINSGEINTLTRPTDEFSVFVRYNLAIPILHKILNSSKHKFISIDKIISPLMPYGLPTNYRGRKNKSATDSITLYTSKGISYINRNEITKENDSIDRYKIMMSKMSSEHAGEPNKEGMFNIFPNTCKVLSPGEVCTHSYFTIGEFDDESTANNALSYLKTKFVRFIVMITLSAVNLSKLVFFNVPIQDFSKPWADKELYEKYELTEAEIEFIESLIKTMD